MLKRNTKRIFAMLLAVALVFGSVSVPTVAYAADEIKDISGISVSKDAITNADRKVEVTVTGTALPETLYYRLYKDSIREVDNTPIVSQGTDTTRTFVVEIPENTSGQDEKWKVWVNYENVPNGWAKSSEITLSANGGSETTDPVGPDEPDTFDNKVLKVKVVDEDGKAVPNLSLFLDIKVGTDVTIPVKTDENGRISCDISKLTDLYSEEEYSLLPVEGSGYTCKEPKVLTFGEEDWKLYLEYVDDDEYTSEITMTVAKEEVKVDKSKLEAAINAYVDKEACTDASYQVYAAALAEAKAVNEDTNATQEAVDAATTKLTKARSALVYLDLKATADKAELPGKGGTVTVTATGILNEKVWWVLQVGQPNATGYMMYTPVGKEVNETAVVDGKATIAVEVPENTTDEAVTYRIRVSATEPKMYAGSYSWSSPKNLPVTVAVKGAEAVDKTALAAAIEKEDNSYKNEGAFLSSTWEVYKTALAAAKTVNAKENATQEEVNTALKNLNAAVSGLTYLSLDKVTVTPDSLESAGGTVTVKAEGILNAKVWWKLEKKSADGSYETEGESVNEAVLSADKTFTIEIPANTAETAAEYRIQVKETQPSPYMWGVTRKATFTVAGKSAIPEEITSVTATAETVAYEGGSVDFTVVGTSLKAEDLEVTGTPAVTVKNLTGTDTELKFTVEFPANTAISAKKYEISVKVKGQDKEEKVSVTVNGVNTISGKDALEHPSYILDVRAEDKIAVTGKIPGSQTCPQFPTDDASLDEKMQAFAERYKDNTDPIYIMCNSGFVGAPRAAKNLLAAGIAPSRIFTIVGGASDEDIRTALVKVGWNQTEDGWTYRNEDGSYISGGWRAIDGSWYYFDAEGYRTEGWNVIGGTWYYFDKATGIMAENGFYDIDGATYYFKAGGAMATGWQVIDGADYFFTGSGAMAKNQWSGSYYLGEDGKMLTNAWAGVYYVGANGVYQKGWLKLDEGWYYLGTNGVVQTGWIQVGNNWYYGQPDSENPGLLVENKFYDINGATYYFKEGGYMAINWQVIDGADYFFTGSGAMAKNQWSGSYYLGADGKMMTNAWVDFYYVGANGVYQKGWLKLEEGWYYLGTNGVLRFGWFQVGNTWYFGDTDPDEGSVGIILENTFAEIDGVTYFFKAGGAMATGWVLFEDENGNEVYSYFNGSGAMVTSAWVGNYYLNEDGVMARNEWVDGGKYYVGDDGLWVPNAQK